MVKKLKKLLKEIEKIDEPILKDIEKGEKKLNELRGQKLELEKEISNLTKKPAMRKIKLKELMELTNNINEIIDNIQYLKESLNNNDDKNKLINLVYEIRTELVKEKNRIVNLEIEIRDKYKKHMEEEIRELWNNEIEFKEAKELYSELAVKGGIYEIAQI